MIRNLALRIVITLIALIGSLVPVAISYANEVELKGLGRFDGWRDNSLIGYGLVVGLSGSGDTRRSGVTKQTLQNVYNRLGMTVSEEQISSRNAAVVIVTSVLPASANVGEKISANIASAGDARSLAGGTLLMTPLLGPDRRAYALAQGPLVTGGFSFESENNLQQRNYPTSARLEHGATVELSVEANLKLNNGELSFLLHEPNFTTARRVAASINTRFGGTAAWAKGADEVRIRYDGGPKMMTMFVSEIENLKVQPDLIPRIVINERTGTVVAGGNVTISSTTVAQGDIKVVVTADNYASQPSFISGFAQDISSLVITNTDLSVDQGSSDVVASFPNSSVADLVQGLSKAGVDTRRMIGILQALKEAGALNSEIVIQ